jgi:hypothetical protein
MFTTPNHPLLTLAASGSSGGDAIRETFRIVQALPLEAHLGVALLMLAGLALWLFGGRLIKPLFAVIGLTIGAVAGLVLLPAAGFETAAGVSGALIGLVIGAVIGLTLALILLKVAIVFAALLGFALVGFLGATIYLQYTPMPDDAPPPPFVDKDTPRASSGRLLFKHPTTGQPVTIEELTGSLREAGRILGGAPGSGADDGENDRLSAIAARCRAAVAETVDAIKSRWNAWSTRERMVVVFSTLGSLALGLLVGVFMPNRATALVTSLAGSAIWLISAVWLINALAPSLNHITDQRPEAWAVVWLLVFLAGLVVQLSGLGRSAPPKGKPRAKAQPDDDEGEDE